MSPAFRPSGARPIYLAPFGLHARMMLGAYLRHTLMIAAALMTIALTIDLWPQVPMLAARFGLSVVTKISEALDHYDYDQALACLNAQTSSAPTSPLDRP